MFFIGGKYASPLSALLVIVKVFSLFEKIFNSMNSSHLSCFINSASFAPVLSLIIQRIGIIHKILVEACVGITFLLGSLAPIERDTKVSQLTF